MKRILSVTLFTILAFGSFASISDGQRRRSSRSAAPSGKISIPCPNPLTKIEDCPDTGCGPQVDPHLNRQKNIPDEEGEPVAKTLQDLRDLPDPVAGFKVGQTREKLEALGEGDKIQVVALALVARPGSAESCNCKLTKARDTDNHIVLVDTLRRKKRGETPKELLHRREMDSITAEFTPRTRLVHSNLTRANLQPLISAAGALKVRITGLLFFDSEHSLGHHLVRHNNWEIHPVLALDYCPKAKTCTGDSDANWTKLGQ
jgi:hypothetical protein